MAKIVVIQGHPDPSGKRYCHALAAAYVEGAESAGHTVTLVEVGMLDIPMLRSQAEWMQGPEATPAELKPGQAACMAADHLVFIYPLWMGTMPAMLHAFIEQVFRPGLPVAYEAGAPKGLFKGKSARIIITMGMPALAYRWYFMAHGLKAMERNILGLIGIRPIRSTLFGMIETVSGDKRRQWLDEVRELGRQAQ